ncbi:MAG: hypothetical protein VYD19_01890, partial [Myxococcota bacterium]|nr:hypothetical protein [Myxococcota bacterium]
MDERIRKEWSLFSLLSGQNLWFFSVALSLCLSACADEEASLGETSRANTRVGADPLSTPGASLGKEDRQALSALPIGFPAAQDLAILLSLDDTPIKTNRETIHGNAFLPQRWLNAVEVAFEETEVADALSLENEWNEWRLVSLRIAPCAPLGTHPGALPEGICWPQVRLVWQPILENFMISWRRVDYYADDRAIHALYRAHPTPGSAEKMPAPLVELRAALAAGEKMDALDPELLRDFSAARDAAIAALLAEVAALRGVISASLESYREEVDERIEFAEPSAERHFSDALRGFLDRYCADFLLDELTAFSLPEGRLPFTIDRWIFIAFEGAEGALTQKEITLRDRERGELLVNLGHAQSVGQEGETEEIEAALAEGGRAAEAIREQVIISAEDRRRLRDRVSDPKETFVETTTCASCHRLAEKRFDFHSFSYLEDEEATITPRV